MNIGIAMGQSGECVTDAPSDGKIHGRKDAAWVEIPDGAVVDSLSGGAANEAPSVRAVNEALGGKASQADISQAVAQIRIPTVANTLTSLSTTDALSAAMGRELNERIQAYVKPPAASSRVVYVALDGDDTSGTGTEEAPFKTLQKAASLFKGHVYESFTIKIKAGTYQEPGFDFTNRGVGSFTIETASGQKDVILQSANTIARQQMFFLDQLGCSVTLRNLDFKVATSGSIIASVLRDVKTPFLTLSSCSVSNGQNVYSGFQTYFSNALIANCSVTNAVNAIIIENGTAFITGSSSANCSIGLRSISGLAVLNGAGLLGSSSNVLKEASGQVFTQ